MTIGAEHSAVLTIDNTSKYVYTFEGWENAEGTVVGDRTIKAKIERSIKQYEVKIVVEDATKGGVNVTTVTVPYETEIIVKDNTITIGTTTITATAKAGYSFVEWTGVVGYVNGNITIKPVFA